MGSLRQVLVACAFIPLAGCAAQILQAAQSDCSTFGFQPGSAEYADCVRGQFNRRQSMVSQSLTSAGRQMTPPAESVSDGATAFLKGQVVRGTSRICSYDRAGSPYVITVGAAEPCPLTQ
jgi:hypothetical protein